MDPQSLHALQLELECKGLDDCGELVRIPGDEPDDIESVQVTRASAGGHRILLKHELDPEVKAKLGELSAEATYERPDLVAEALGDYRVTWVRGRSYIFPPDLSDPPNVSRVMPDPTGAEPTEPWVRRPMFVVLVGGVRASYCRSSRENDRAAEAWVETTPEFRRQGLATSAVVAWARDARRAGKVAFYSHDEDNVASAGVARTLGLLEWLSFVNFEIKPLDSAYQTLNRRPSRRGTAK